MTLVSRVLHSIPTTLLLLIFCHLGGVMGKLVSGHLVTCGNRQSQGDPSPQSPSPSCPDGWELGNDKYVHPEVLQVSGMRWEGDEGV